MVLAHIHQYYHNIIKALASRSLSCILTKHTRNCLCWLSLVHPRSLDGIAVGRVILGVGSPVEQAGVDQKNLNSFVNPGRVILGGGSPVEAGVDQKKFGNPRA